jgi:hypothetical protein
MARLYLFRSVMKHTLERGNKMLRQKCLLSRMDIPNTNTHIINLFLLFAFLSVCPFSSHSLLLSQFHTPALNLSFSFYPVTSTHTHTHTHTHTFRLLSLAPSSHLSSIHVSHSHSQSLFLTLTLAFPRSLALPLPLALPLCSLALATLRYKVPPARDVCSGDSRRRISRCAIFLLYS